MARTFEVSINPDRWVKARGLSEPIDEDLGFRVIVFLKGLCSWGLYRGNGKENGNYHIMVGYILGFRV